MVLLLISIFLPIIITHNFNKGSGKAARLSEKPNLNPVLIKSNVLILPGNAHCSGLQEENTVTLSVKKEKNRMAMISFIVGK